MKKYQFLCVAGLLVAQTCGCIATRPGLTAQTTPRTPASVPLNVGDRSKATSPADQSDLGEDAAIVLASSEDPLNPSGPESGATTIPPQPVSAPSTGWTLANLESAALTHNPSIRQASSSAHKAMGFRDQVGLKPNPTVGYNGTQLADEGTDQHTAFVEQQFVVARKLARNQEVLDGEVQSQLWEVEAQRYRVLTDVRQHYYGALAAQRRLALTESFHEIAAKGVDVAKVRLDAKEGTVPEVLQAEILLNQVEIQRRQAAAAFRGTWKQLMAVTGLPGTPSGSLDGVLPDQARFEDLQQILAETLAASPELQAARARVSRSRANIGRQEVQAIPNPTFFMGGGIDRGTNSGMINAQVGLPLPLYNRNEGNITAAQAEFARACEEVRRLELSIESRIARAGQEYEAAAAAVEQYRTVTLPKAEEALKLTEQAYSAGEFDFLQVLIVRRTFFDANLEYVIAQRDLAQAEVYLEGMVLSGGLDDTRDTELDAGLRDQSLTGE